MDCIIATGGKIKELTYNGNAIYFFYRNNKQLIYVGSSRAVKTRLLTHSLLQRDLRKEKDSIKVLIMPVSNGITLKELRDIEYDYILTHDPYYNIVHKPKETIGLAWKNRISKTSIVRIRLRTYKKLQSIAKKEGSTVTGMVHKYLSMELNKMDKGLSKI